MSWGWRKILQIRERVKPFLWSKLGNGKSTSIWYDRWCPQSPINQYLSPRVNANEGYNLKNCVANLISHGGWSWPLAWLRKAPNLGIVPVATLEDSRLDTPQWRDSNGKFSTFSVKVAWDALRQRGTEFRGHLVCGMSHLSSVSPSLVLKISHFQSMASSSNIYSPDRDPKNLSVNEFDTQKVEPGLDQTDEEKMCI
nr:hypothetical protein [Tanacetum cinerariifolium]